MIREDFRALAERDAKELTRTKGTPTYSVLVSLLGNAIKAYQAEFSRLTPERLREVQIRLQQCEALLEAVESGSNPVPLY